MSEREREREREGEGRLGLWSSAGAASGRRARATAPAGAALAQWGGSSASWGRAAGCGLAPVTEAGRCGLGATGSTAPQGRREQRTLGHGTQGTEMQYGRKRWLARIRNGGRGGHGAVRRDRRPCRDSVAAGGSSPRARLRLGFGAVSPAAPAGATLRPRAVGGSS